MADKHQCPITNCSKVYKRQQDLVAHGVCRHNIALIINGDWKNKGLRYKLGTLTKAFEEKVKAFKTRKANNLKSFRSGIAKKMQPKFQRMTADATNKQLLVDPKQKLQGISERMNESVVRSRVTQPTDKKLSLMDHLIQAILDRDLPEDKKAELYTIIVKDFCKYEKSDEEETLNEAPQVQHSKLNIKKYTRIPEPINKKQESASQNIVKNSAQPIPSERHSKSRKTFHEWICY